MKKVLSLLMLLVAIVTGASAEDASLNAFPTGTTSFKTGDTGYYDWGTSKTKNAVIYDTNTRIMLWSNGNNLDQDANGLKIGNSSKKSAFVFKVADASDISVEVARNGSDMTVSIYYLGTTTDVLTDPNSMTPTGALDSEDISSSNSSATLTVENGAAGYYMVFGTLRFYASSITVTKAVSSDKPTITTQPVGATYQVDGEASALSVVATASAGDLAYQWYTCEDAEGTNPEAIATATASTYTPSTESTGTTYYYVVVSDDNGSVTSDIVAVNVVTEEAPEVEVSISSTLVRTGAEVTATANVTAGVPEPTLQWYSCDDAEGTNAQAIDGATSATYQPSTATVGTFYFLVKASNSVAADVASNVVSFKAVDAGVAGTVDDLVAVSEGYVFVADNVTADGTLKPATNTLYDEGKVFVSAEFAVATNKGSNTFGGASHLNSMRLKNSTDYIAFKVADACLITFYVENPKKDTRNFKVGNAANDDTYGLIPDGQTTASIFIPAAGTVYVTGPGSDRYFGGFEVSAASYDVEVGETGFATVSFPQAVTIPAGVDAYYASASDASTVTLTKVEDDAVAANTGLIISTTIGTHTFGIAAEGTAYDDNQFVATSTGAKTVEADETIYVLAKNGDKGVAMKKAGEGVTVAVNKAYLPGAGSATKYFVFEGETAIDGVAEVPAQAAAKGAFNLAGQAVSAAAKGIVIVDGVKVVK